MNRTLTKADEISSVILTWLWRGGYETLSKETAGDTHVGIFGCEHVKS